MPPIVLTTDLVITAIREMNGNLAAIARRYGLTRGAVKNFVDRHPTCRAAYEDMREQMVDTAESMLMKQVLEGDPGQVRYLLSTLGRNRGYIQRQEHIVYTPEQIARMDDEALDRAIEQTDL